MHMPASLYIPSFFLAGFWVKLCLTCISSGRNCVLAVGKTVCDSVCGRPCDASWVKGSAVIAEIGTRQGLPRAEQEGVPEEGHGDADAADGAEEDPRGGMRPRTLTHGIR